MSPCISLNLATQHIPDSYNQHLQTQRPQVSAVHASVQISSKVFGRAEPMLLGKSLPGAVVGIPTAHKTSNAQFDIITDSRTAPTGITNTAQAIRPPDETTQGTTSSRSGPYTGRAAPTPLRSSLSLLSVMLLLLMIDPL